MEVFDQKHLKESWSTVRIERIRSKIAEIGFWRESDKVYSHPHRWSRNGSKGKINGAGKGSHWWGSWNDGCLWKTGNHHCSTTSLACLVRKPTQKTCVRWPIEVEGLDHYSHDKWGSSDRENFLFSASGVHTTSGGVADDVGRECECTASRRVHHDQQSCGDKWSQIDKTWRLVKTFGNSQSPDKKVVSMVIRSFASGSVYDPC